MSAADFNAGVSAPLASHPPPSPLAGEGLGERGKCSPSSQWPTNLPTHLPTLRAHELTIKRGARVLCEALSFDAQPNDCWVIIGPNGAGKSTLLLTLAGLLPPAQGRIEWHGASLPTLNALERARHRAFLASQQNDVFSATVFDAVLAGRHPHLAAWQWEGAADLAAAEKALKSLKLDALATRDVRTLSAGERQRVALAAMLAQAPSLYLLDEPASHLDPAQQIEALDTVLTHARQHRAAVVMVLHELHLATRYADHVILLGDDRTKGKAQTGSAAEMLTTERLSSLFGAAMVALEGEQFKSFVPGAGIRDQGLGIRDQESEKHVLTRRREAAKKESPRLAPFSKGVPAEGGR
ncbi:MAG: ABC transporter ATP-binding protein, partial [Proteobacteria bacterium]|nr:ABC transporter ATP-binding protein [Pseudomonadota bacterium]